MDINLDNFNRNINNNKFIKIFNNIHAYKSLLYMRMLIKAINNYLIKIIKIINNNAYRFIKIIKVTLVFYYQLLL